MPWGTWTPSELQRVERVVGSSMDTVVVLTDAGVGYLKVLGNRQGEHALACELIGSSLADWLGLPTLDFAVFDLPRGGPMVWLDDDDATPRAKRRVARPGPGFITRAVRAETWDGTAEGLARCDNHEMIAGLVLLDTWIANPDRHPRRPPDPSLSTWARQNLDNVLLEIRGRGRRRLVAMDFSVCLHCRGGQLRRGYDLALVQDEGIYGLFPAFEPYVEDARLRPFLDRLGDREGLQQHLVEVLDRIRDPWQVDRGTRAAVGRFLSARAAWLAENFIVNLGRIPPATAT